MSDRKKPCINICSTAIPRLTTRECVVRLMDHWRDRPNWRVRWIWHLDQYPGLERHWEQNVQEAAQLVPYFEEVDLLASSLNVGYGRAHWRVWSRVPAGEHLLNLEDDFLAQQDFRLCDIVEASRLRRRVYGSKAAGDGLFLGGPQVCRFGGTAPAYWAGHVLPLVFAAWPSEQAMGEKVPHEKPLKRHLGRKCGLRYGHQGHVPEELFRECGRQALLDLGVTTGFDGRDLATLIAASENASG